jgi:hypothetical protein
LPLFRHKLMGAIIQADQFFTNKPLPKGVCVCTAVPGGEHKKTVTPHVHTLSGPVDVTDGDYVVREGGLITPAKKLFFEEIYQRET